MTEFESLCNELGIPITIDRDGEYTGHCKALALIVNEIILSDNEAVLSLSWEEQKKIIKENFLRRFHIMTDKEAHNDILCRMYHNRRRKEGI